MSRRSPSRPQRRRTRRRGVRPRRNGAGRGVRAVARVVRSNLPRRGRVDRSRVGPARARPSIFAGRAPSARDDRARALLDDAALLGAAYPRTSADATGHAARSRRYASRASPVAHALFTSRPLSRREPHRPRSPLRGRTRTRSTRSTSTGRFRSGWTGRRRPRRCRCASGWPAAVGCSTPRRPPNRPVGGSPPRRSVPSR